MVQQTTNITVTSNADDQNQTPKPAGWRNMKILVAVLLLGLFVYKFPNASLWITTKLFGAVSATTSAAGSIAIKAAETTVKVAEQAKNAAEAELARRLIVQEALAALTPCSMLRCTSEMASIVELLSKLKQAHHKATTTGDADACAPILPSDEAGRYLLATAAPWLVQQPRGSLPRSECTTTVSSKGDTEETCTFETNLLPCSNAVKWPKLAPVLDEPLKILNQKLADTGAKQKERLQRMLSAPDQDGEQPSLASKGELTLLMEEVLSDHFFVPAAPRPSTVRVTPYREDAEQKQSPMGEKTVLEKLEVLRKDQKIKPQARFCKRDGYADSTAGFCGAATKLTKDKLTKAIEVVEGSQRTKLAR